MKIILAEHAGFCFGVKRAASSALKLAREGVSVVTLGELIHNEAFVSYLKSEGIDVVEELSEVPAGATVLIRSHGVPPEIYKTLTEKEIPFADLTCPFVTRIHKKVEVAQASFDKIVVVGKPEHPEVIGICGWAGEKAMVISTKEDAEAFFSVEKLLIVAQTTISQQMYEEICSVLEQKAEHVEVFHSICETTIERQQETALLAERSSCVIVIGDKKSSNSTKLYEIAQQHCKKVDFIESAEELLLENYKDCDIISIVAGASAPEWIIREVCTRMSELEKTQVTEEAAANEEAQAAPQEPIVEETIVEETVEEIPAEATADEDTVEQEEETEEVAEEEPVVAETIIAEVTEEPAAVEEEEEEASFEEQLEKTFVRIRRGQFVKGTVVLVTDDEVCVNIGYKADGLIQKENLTVAGDVVPSELFKPGDEIEAEVISLNDGEGNVVLSRKKIEGQQQWREFVESLDMDAFYEAKITRVIKGGVLAKFGEYDAFIPASQLSMNYVEDLNVFLDQTIPVKIIDVDKRQKRFVLSNKEVLKAHMEEQEKQMFESFEKGSVVRGVVKRLTDFGAFVDVGGVDGLLHITDISWGRIKHPKDVLEEGQEVDVKILNVDADKKRISLGYKQLQPRPWELVPEKYHVGDIIEGKVVRLAPFGAFVELEPTVDGLIHISQVTNRRIEKVEDVLTQGQTVKAKVLEVDAGKRRISLSMRALMEQERPAGDDEGGREAGAAAGRRPRAKREEKFTLPPVEEATTSLADLFKVAEEESADEE